TGAGPQASEATTVKVTGIEHAPVGAMRAMSPGQMIDGGSPATVTVCVQTLVLPLPSVAVQVTFVMPNGNGEGALLATVTGPTASLAIAVPRLTWAEHWPAGTFVLTLVGQLSAGGVVSRTTMLKTR